MDHEPLANEQAARVDAARIAAEIVDAGRGTDPFVAAVRATRMPMCITDPRLPDNPIVFANDAFTTLTGYQRDEAIGRNCRFLQGPDTDPAAVATLRAALAARTPLKIDIRNYRKDGTAFWNRLLIGPVFDGNGGLTYYFASQVDVTTERERLAVLESDNASLTVEVADRARAQYDSEERLRFAAEAGRLGLWEVDLATLELTSSPIFRENFGFARDAPMTDDDARAAIHPDDRERVAAAVAATRDRGERFDIEFRVVRRDGVAWVHQRAQLVHAPDGTPLRIAGTSLDVTARKAAEVALALSEETLRLSTDAAGVGTWDLDLTTDVLTWTALTKAMFGISPDVPCSMADFYAGLHPDDAAATAAAFAAAIDPALRSTYDVEYRTIGKEDGVVRWVAARGKGLFDGNRCVRAIGTAIDITRRRRADERQRFLLDLSDAIRTTADPQEVKRLATLRLGAFLDVNRVGYAEVDDDGITALLDAPYLRDAEPIDGRVVLDDFGVAMTTRLRAGETIVDGDVAAGPDTPSGWAAIATRAHVSVPIIRDGRLRGTLFVLCNAPTLWADDNVALIEEVAARTWDAVERARAEAETHASEARLGAVVAAAPIGLIFAQAPDGAIVGGNARAEAILRHPIIPSPDVEHYREWVSFHPDGRQVEGHEYPLARALAGEELPELESLYRRGDGTEAYLRFVAAPVRGPDGGIAGGVVASIDIDRERRAEMALRDLNATLERRVDERTAELFAAEEALRQAQKMEAVGQLTGGIAHDFNNMLAVVLGSLDLLGRRLAPDDARARRYVDAALDGARRAATLTQRLLAFSRQQPLQPETIDVNRLVAGMSDLLRGSLGGGVQLETVLAGGLWPIHADPNQLENILLNLGINARDAMNGEGRLTIETHNCHLDDRYVAAEIGVAAGQYVLIAVTDAGAGMPPEVVAKAFDPFFTTKGVGKGTGLGLSQVYGFVKQSGGHVKIYSEVGVGTTVKLYLPRLIGAAADAAAADEPGTPVGGDGHELILVVEDEPGVRAISVEALRDLGYRVIEADCAAAALRLLDAHDVDLLFTDIVMPEMNGAKLVEAARAVRPGLKVLFTTGYTRNAVVHNGVVDAGVELIGKPFTIDALAAKVRGVLDG